ncbi:hypothetical protein DNTS_028561 [Danionella cerebrum]|uniref:PWWP domain-containing protein n=1 Tax=Danionella cerebrum TaxID=2873325 RepID=A0A553MSU3_9TELE|nr:hypothetical protein DNTS_028561 [Danionella translucida]
MAAAVLLESKCVSLHSDELQMNACIAAREAAEIQRTAAYSQKLTPKRSGIRSIPLLSSTPKYNRQPLSPEKSEDSVRHPNSSKTPPTGSTTSRPLRARIRSKQNVQESPSTSQPVKRRRKTTLVPVESPQEEPSEESQTPCETSSDLSIELSQREATLSLFLEEEEEDEEELPSFLWQEIKRPLSFTEGLCVWCKLRKYPYWPAVIKSVNQKSKKASIVFIDTFLNDQKRTIKGISVSLRNLKHFDCEEFSNLVELAKEKYGSSITWSLDLISDYQIRLGCGSFSGTFIDFYAADISLPVRKNLSEGKSLLTFPGQEILAELSDVQTEDVVEEKHHEVLSKKILPDRTKAARTHANKKLVDFIIKKKVERHLLGILSGRESSKWMQAFLKPFQRVACPVYLEDEEQVDQVFQYLDKLCKNSENSCADLLQGDRIRLILDVLLPERAEEKYRRGPCFSNRERQEFDMMIEEQMKLKQIPPPQS